MAETLLKYLNTEIKLSKKIKILTLILKMAIYLLNYYQRQVF